MAKRLLILENGMIFEGEAFGADLFVTGEIVFNTGMTGYQESITDQSYNGQILTFTYPLVGNYGVNRDDYESILPTCKGVVVYEYARRASNWRQQLSLDEFLKIKKIPGISGIDTRALTKIIRQHGTMRAIIANANGSIERLQDQLQSIVLPTDNIKQVSTKQSYPAPGTGRNVVLVDFGLKHSILRELAKRNCSVTVVPYNTSAEEILQLNPDGVMLSNGPGNPEDVPEALDMIRGIQGKIPIFGICMGHQLFSMANGAKTHKMKFGHRGFNHAVREIATGKIEMTSQNHLYSIVRDSLPHDLLVTHENVNDHSIEAFRHRYQPILGVQFQVDASPGPRDNLYFYDEFLELIDAKIHESRREKE